MSRSRRKIPIISMTTADSDKRFKQAEHRRERRSVNQMDLTAEDVPSPREFGNPWASEKDGKQYLDQPADPRFLRK